MGIYLSSIFDIESVEVDDLFMSIDKSDVRITKVEDYGDAGGIRPATTSASGQVIEVCFAGDTPLDDRVALVVRSDEGDQRLKVSSPSSALFVRSTESREVADRAAASLVSAGISPPAAEAAVQRALSGLRLRTLEDLREFLTQDVPATLSISESDNLDRAAQAAVLLSQRTTSPSLLANWTLVVPANADSWFLLKEVRESSTGPVCIFVADSRGRLVVESLISHRELTSHQLAELVLQRFRTGAVGLPTTNP